MSQKYCQWKKGNHADEWVTECESNYYFSGHESGPGENGFCYCPYCGGRLVKEYGPNGRTP